MKKNELRMIQAPDGSEIRVGVGQTVNSSKRCKEQHDVPYSLRCTLPLHHKEIWGTAHLDKQGGTW